MFLNTFSPSPSNLFHNSPFNAVADKKKLWCSTILQKKRDFTNKSTVAEVTLNNILPPPTLMLDLAVLNNLKLLNSSGSKTVVHPLFGLLLGRYFEIPSAVTV